MRPSTRAIKSLITVALLSAACGKHESDSYFPLDVGTQWVYAVETEVDGKTISEQQIISVIKEFVDNNRPVAIRRSETGHNIGLEYWIGTMPGMIARIAQRSDLEERATMDDQPRTVLPLPVKQGAVWNSLTVPYLILRKSEFPRELKFSHKALMTYTVESMDETVSVPAGTFTQCARVSGLAYVTLYTDPVSGFRKVPLVTNEWYCKGVGLVKMERNEALTTAFFSGGRMSMQLTELRRL